MVLLAPLITSWRIGLQARNLSAKTIQNYETALALFSTWCQANGRPIDPALQAQADVRGWLSDELAGDRFNDGSVLTHYRCLQQWFRWLLDEGEITASPMARIAPPKAEEGVRPIIPDEDLAKLLESCKGGSWRDRRDLAIIRLLIDSGIRLGELVGIKLVDLDLPMASVLVLGKGKRERIVPLGAKTVQAIDRYLRVRARQKYSASDHLWISGGSGQICDESVRILLQMRARKAGVTRPIYPHLFRHTYAHNWLVLGGQEQDLMSNAGWRTRSMIDRYGKSAAAARARQAHKRLGPGDRL